MINDDKINDDNDNKRRRRKIKRTSEKVLILDVMCSKENRETV